ncbi:MAG TPA: CHASE3 domain-containing protein [Chitinophagaceae bacterium]
MLSVKGKIRSGYVLAFLLLVVSYFLIFHTIRKLNKESDMVTRNLVIMNRLESLRGDITEAETGMRGYIITNDERFLQSYHTARQNIPRIMVELQKLSHDNPRQLQRLDTLDFLLKRKLEFLSQGFINFQQGGFTITPKMLKDREPSKNVMDSIRLFVNKLEKTEEQMGQQRQSSLSRFFYGTQTITIISLITAILAIIYSVVIYNNENKAKERADKKVNKYRTEQENYINELKNMNHELQEFRSMEKFTATGRIARTIAHEVRNPLTNIFLATEQLKEVSGSLPETDTLFDMIERNAGRINQLVSDLLNATKFVHLEFKKTGINQLLEETLDMAMDRIELNNIRVEKYYSDEICDVAVDKEKIKLAVLNVIVNAIEAMEKNNGVLQIKTKKQGHKCLIEIRDNGTGMDEDALQKLFDPYFTSKPNGNGLGLTNTQSIILSHKGSIKAYSKPGEGTVFIFVLNLADSDIAQRGNGKIFLH